MLTADGQHPRVAQTTVAWHSRIMIDRNQDTTAASLFASAETLQRQGRFDEATEAYKRTIAAAPGAIEPRVALGHLLLKMGRPRGAMAVFAEAVGLDPHLRAVCRDVDGFSTEEARSNAVLENCRHILARYPAYAEAHYGRACALLNLGREAEARRASEQALVLNATVPAYYHVLIHTGDPRRNASAVSSLEHLAQAEHELDDQDRATLHFLLAKAYEDQGRAADAFAHLTKGNAVKRGMIVYDEGRELGRMDAIASTFSPERLAALRDSGFSSTLPVFVVGMPRSGTTLVEQILASHPAVFGAGELTTLPDLVKEQFGSDVPTAIAPEVLRNLGEAYVARVRTLAPEAQRIVDKMPYNFLNAGLTALALPAARIIHVRRDPLDTCFSCYALSFSGEVGFAYDMVELGRYYRAYEKLMAHWRAALPPTVMLEVQYENLIADLPGEARRMVEYCGLDWDPRCLDFHKSRRAVATASLHQVRQPLYTSSIGRARAHADQLGPLREALGVS